MGGLSTGGAQPTQNQTQQIRDATGASDVENAAAHVTARVNNRQQARLTRQWQSDLVQHANQVNNTLDPSTPAGHANVLSTNIMIQTLNVANSYALVPMQNEINDLANLQNVVTNVQSSLNTMSNFLSNVVGSPLSGQQYENQFNSFVSSYDNLFLAGQPGNSANKLGDMNLYVRVMEPAHMVKGKMVQPQVVTVAVPADSPIMQTYWNKFEKSMPPLVGPNGQDYFGGNSKNQMFIGGTANANTAVSGVQYYAIEKIQTVLDQQSPMNLSSFDPPLSFSPDDIAAGLVDELENGTPPVYNSKGKIIKKRSKPLYQPSMTGSNDAVITQFWNVFNDVPQVPYNGTPYSTSNPTSYPGGVKPPPYSTAAGAMPALPGENIITNGATGAVTLVPPGQTLVTDPTNHTQTLQPSGVSVGPGETESVVPISMQQALLTGNKAAVQQNVVVWQYIAQQKEATSPPAWFVTAGSPLSQYEQNLDDATNSLSSISTSMINQIQMISSELQIIDNIVSKMISSFTGMTQAIVNNYRGG